MKKILLILIIGLAPALLLSQNAKMKDLFTDYENSSSFSYSHGTSDTDMNLGLNSDVEKLFNNVNEVYILKSKNKSSENEIADFQEKFQKLIDKGSYENLMEINSDGTFKLYLKRNGDSDPSEVIIIKTDDDSSMYLWATS